MPYFTYSHYFTHIAYKVEVSTQSSVLLPLPPVCMQVNEYIPNAMTQFPSALPFPLLGFALSLFLFTDSLTCWRWRREELDTGPPWYDVCMYADQVTHFFTLQVHRLHLPYQISLHTPSDPWGGMSKENNEGDVHWFLQLLTPSPVSLLSCSHSAESKVAGLEEVGGLWLHFSYCGCYKPFIYT